MLDKYGRVVDGHGAGAEFGGAGGTPDEGLPSLKTVNGFSALAAASAVAALDPVASLIHQEVIMGVLWG